jgi:acetylornithine deacetylase
MAQSRSERPHSETEWAGRIDELRDAGIDVLGRLIAIDSTNPTFPGVESSKVIGGETLCNEALREKYDEAGLESHWVAEDKARKNLVGIRRGKGGGRSLILNAHVDTVPPVAPSQWTSGSPWKPSVTGDRVVGLGATDMKGGGVAMWLAAQALHDLGIELEGDLLLQSVVGEEMGEHELGTSACVKAGFTADAAIVTEASSLPRSLTISPVSPGCWELRILVRGKSTHCGNRPLAIRPWGPGDSIGVNAVEKAIKLVLSLHDLEEEWAFSKRHPYFSPGFFTILPGVFHADAGLPIPSYFADRAEVRYVVWHSPKETGEEVVSEITGYLQTVCQLDPWLRHHPPELSWIGYWGPMSTSWDHPLVQSLRRAYQSVTGEEVRDPGPDYPVGFGAVADGTWLQEAGIPSVVFGPGDITVAHAVDEFISIDELLTAAKVLAATAVDWCGLG